MFEAGKRFLTIFAALTLIHVPAQTFAEEFDDDEEYEDTAGVLLAEIAAEEVANNCPCPDDDSSSAQAKFEKCLSKHGSKAGVAFKKAAKYVHDHSAFKSMLNELVEAYEENCAYEEEDPEDGFPEEDEEEDA